jgi:hypothetical protein
VARETEPTDDPSARPKKVPRRRFLKAGVGAAVLVATGGVAALVRTRGYDLPPERVSKLVYLAPWQVIVLEHVARRIAAPDRPGDASIPSADDVDVVGFLDGYIARMRDKVRRDIGRLLAYVEHVAPIRIGLWTRFSRLGPVDQDRVLADLEASGEDLLRGGFDGLKSLVFMGYYRDARTWKILGYDGPLVGRPAQGWQRWER